MKTDYLLNLQALRGIAAGSVAYYHLQPMLRESHGFAGSSHVGAFGVDIFFVISGFVMYLSNPAMNKPVAPFLIGRFFRIVPLYWLATLVMVAFYYAGYQPSGLVHFEPYMLLQSLFFVTTLFPDDRYDLILVLGWTLIYELFFYFVFSLTFRMRNMVGSLAVVSAVFSVLVVLGEIFPNIPPRLGFFLNPIIFEFLFGGLLATAFVSWQSRKLELPGSSSTVAGISIAGAVALVFGMEAAGLGMPQTTRALLWGVPAAVIVGSLVVLEMRGMVSRNRFILMLGSASYALYLFHPVVMQGSLKVIGRFQALDYLGAGFAMAAGLASAVIAAFIVHLTIERRVIAPLAQRVLERCKPGQGRRKPFVPSTG